MGDYPGDPRFVSAAWHDYVPERDFAGLWSRNHAPHHVILPWIQKRLHWQHDGSQFILSSGLRILWLATNSDTKESDSRRHIGVAVGYGLMILCAIVAFLLIRSYGETLVAPPTAQAGGDCCEGGRC